MVLQNKGMYGCFVWQILLIKQVIIKETKVKRTQISVRY